MPQKKRPSSSPTPASSDTPTPAPALRKTPVAKDAVPDAGVPPPAPPAASEGAGEGSVRWEPVKSADPGAVAAAPKVARPKSAAPRKGIPAAGGVAAKKPIAPEKKKPTVPESKVAKPRRPAKSADAPEIATATEALVPAVPPVDRPAASVTVQQTVAEPAVTPPVTPGPAPAVRQPTPAPDALSILMVTPEAHPFAKTGGLAEVAAALPQALARMGHAVTLVLPRYRGIDTAGTTVVPIAFRLGTRHITLSVLERRLPDGVLLALVDAPDLFDRVGLYGDASGDYPDNAWRFAVFSRAAIEYARARKVRPSVIQVHDWQTGLVPVYQKMAFSSDPVVGGVPVIFTIHNLAFQGLFPASTVETIGLGWNVMDIEAMEYWGQISYLKAGINFSEKIATVSPTYASEITTPELGFGFDGILRRRADDLVGILNGIDTSRWNPAADVYVPAAFTADDLSGKQVAKRALLEAADAAPGPYASPNLRKDSRAMVRPLIGLVSRLTDQKGFDLIAASADELMSLDASWVMLGSGEPRYEDFWRALAARFAGRVSATIGFDERLAHLIEAGADMFLMPSRFEPCGLNQLYSLRYGTLPIVRATGGLKDTVEDAGANGKGTGFTFSQYTPGALVAAVRRALAAFRNQDLWRAMQRRAMQQDHSWDASAREYVKVYRALTGDQPARAAGTFVTAAPTDR
jgi:starch synthase